MGLNIYTAYRLLGEDMIGKGREEEGEEGLGDRKTVEGLVKNGG